MSINIPALPLRFLHSLLPKQQPCEDLDDDRAVDILTVFLVANLYTDFRVTGTMLKMLVGKNPGLSHDTVLS